MEIYFQIIQKRFKYILLTTIIAVGTVAFITLQTKPYYTSSTKLLIAPYGLGNLDYATYMYSEQISATFSSILSSDSVMKEAATRLGIHLDDLPDYTYGIIARSELLEISVISQDPILAKDAGETLAEVVLEKTQLQ